MWGYRAKSDPLDCQWLVHMNAGRDDAVTFDLPLAEHSKMDARGALAQEFFRATSAELAPFVSDEATWYAFDYLDDDEVGAAIQAHYGIAVDHAKLAMPFWAFLDYLDANRVRGAG